MKDGFLTSKSALIFLALLFCTEIQGAMLTTLFYFGGTNGANPRARLVYGADGKLYGTTAFGGIGYGEKSPPSGHGTVFRISNGGEFELLYSFGGYPDAGGPVAGLIQGADGNFYGTTSSGGTGSLGTVYRLTPDGNTTIIKSFGFDGTNGHSPLAPLCQGMDGSFYGTTEDGGRDSDGDSDYGTVFQLKTNGAFTTLFSFTSTSFPGVHPKAGLVQGPDGVLYGTAYGNVGFDGTIFKITTNGNTSTLVSFARTNGSHPMGELIFGHDGALYGTTSGEYAQGNGTVFRVTTNGILNTLASFAYTNGGNPQGPLVLGNDGDLYGTTSAAGAEWKGTVFRIQADGKLITLVSFNGTNGANPTGGLVQGVDGDFYGTTPLGGISNNGTIFRLSLKPVIEAATWTNGQIKFSWNADVGAPYQVQYTTNLSHAYWSNLFSVVQATNTTMTSTDSNISDGSRFYRVVLLP